MDRYRRATTSGVLGATLSQLQREYEELLAKHCGQSITSAAPRAAFGDPPAMDLSRTRFVGAERRGRTIIVTTDEREPPPLATRRFEYVLEQAGRDWVITDRRTRDSDGRMIRRIL